MIPHNKKFIEIPKITLELSYILGVMCGDGSIIGGRNIRLGCKDHEFADEFNRCIEILFGKCSIFISRKMKYVCFCSKDLCNKIETKWGNFKTKTWTVLYSILNTFIS